MSDFSHVARPGAPVEIERKFLVKDRPWVKAGAGVSIRQGYLARGQGTVVRVRVAGERASLTVKGPAQGISRLEFEFSIPFSDAEAMLELCEGHIIRKTRYQIQEQAVLFELDVFEDENAGLVVAEIELESEKQTFTRPAWLGEEVSLDPRYRNSELSRRPYSAWED